MQFLAIMVSFKAYVINYKLSYLSIIVYWDKAEYSKWFRQILVQSDQLCFLSVVKMCWQLIFM